MITPPWDRGAGPAPLAAPALVRAPEHRLAAFTLAALLLAGGGAGLLFLVVEGVLREDAPRSVYGTTMVLTMMVALPLLVRRKVDRQSALGLVLVGHLAYLVVALSIEDPIRYASPVVLLFPVFIAGCFLGARLLAATMVLTATVCLAALWSSYPDPLALAVQVAVSTGMLSATALGVFLLRRRVRLLLLTSQLLSSTDPLTGLFNRRFLAQQAPRLWRQARRDGTRVAAMVLDIDHFKRLNDEHGHSVGDAVLQSVAASLASAVRPADVLVRTGGEEMVVLGLVGDPAEAARLAERLRSAVAGTTTERHTVTASVGVALTRPTDGEDAVEAMWRLVDEADQAMYDAKRNGRNRVSAPAPFLGVRPPQGAAPAISGSSPTDLT